MELMDAAGEIYFFGLLFLLGVLGIGWVWRRVLDKLVRFGL